MESTSDVLVSSEATEADIYEIGYVFVPIVLHTAAQREGHRFFLKFHDVLELAEFIRGLRSLEDGAAIEYVAQENIDYDRLYHDQSDEAHFKDADVTILLQDIVIEGLFRVYRNMERSRINLSARVRSPQKSTCLLRSMQDFVREWAFHKSCDESGVPPSEKAVEEKLRKSIDLATKSTSREKNSRRVSLEIANDLLRDALKLPQLKKNFLRLANIDKSLYRITCGALDHEEVNLSNTSAYVDERMFEYLYSYRTHLVEISIMQSAVSYSYSALSSLFFSRQTQPRYMTDEKNVRSRFLYWFMTKRYFYRSVVRKSNEFLVPSDYASYCFRYFYRDRMVKSFLILRQLVDEGRIPAILAEHILSFLRFHPRDLENAFQYH